GKAYACICTRKEVDLAASAPHAEDGASVYPGTCRGRFMRIEDARNASGRDPAIRFNVGDDIVEFVDEFSGAHRFEMPSLGDFVIEKADRTPAYQLAVVVDDADMGVTDIFRGDDLLDSTPRQLLLYRALNLADRIPAYTHLPLVIGPDGKRLAKRHGDTRIASYRDAGVPSERLLAMLASWCGIDNIGGNVRAANLVGKFDLQRLSPSPIVFDPAVTRLESSPR
ncbi:MAG: glutamyl-tRNA synthetase, partial [Humisphaera sp.]|nr:glutamyl-tRNA synthetase [Humisphaera sp.]